MTVVRTRPGLFGALACGLVASACATTNTVLLAPLETPFPVSASGSYVENDGTIVPPSEQDVVGRFSFEGKIVARALRSTTTSLALKTPLTQEVEAAHGEAITGLTITPIDYDPGEHLQAARLRIVGAVALVTGLAVLLIGPRGEQGSSPAVLGLWGAISAAGAVGVAGPYLFDFAPSRWTLNVEGRVVKRRADTRAGSTEGGSKQAPASDE